MLKIIHGRLTIFLVICLVNIVVPAGSAEISQEYQLKAAFLVNFARFIKWPEAAFSSSHNDIVLCVAGENPFGDALNAVESKKIQGHNLRISYVASLEDVDLCHLLFASKSEERNIELLRTILKDQAVVTVSDLPGFASRGGAIEFVRKRDRLSFIINNSLLKKLGIQAGASMLDLAVEIR